MSGHQEIRCSVQNCRHNNKNNFCMLKNIQVGETNFDAQRKRDTQCGNFEAEI